MLRAAEAPGTHAVRDARKVAMSHRAVAIMLFSVGYLTAPAQLVFLSITVTVDITSVLPPDAHWSLTDACLRPAPDRPRRPGRGLSLHRPMRPKGVWPKGYGSGLNATTTAACTRASFASAAQRPCGPESRERRSWVYENRNVVERSRPGIYGFCCSEASPPSRQ